MQYTIKQLAKLSGISVRTLHWYDSIGLLSPAYHKTNGYRVYEEKQLLQLQQILFFKELGFKLSDVQQLLVSNEFDKLKALEVHRKALAKNIERYQKLLLTIDKTMLHIRGENTMQDKEIFSGFDLELQQQGARICHYQGTIAEDIIGANITRQIEPNSAEAKEVSQQGTAIFNALLNYMNSGLTPRAAEVQQQITKHVQMLQTNTKVSKDVYLAYAQLYCEAKDFRSYFDKLHPQLAAFIAEAMRVYAHANLQ